MLQELNRQRVRNLCVIRLPCSCLFKFLIFLDATFNTGRYHQHQWTWISLPVNNNQNLFELLRESIDLYTITMSNYRTQ